MLLLCSGIDIPSALFGWLVTGTMAVTLPCGTHSFQDADEDPGVARPRGRVVCDEHGAAAELAAVKIVGDEVGG